MWSKIFHITLWLTLVTFIPVATGVNKMIMEEVASSHQMVDIVDIPLEDQLEPTFWSFDFSTIHVSYKPNYVQASWFSGIAPLLSTPPPEV